MFNGLVKMTVEEIQIFPAIKISKKKMEEFLAWKKEQTLKAIEIQKSEISKDDPFYSTCVTSWEMGYPYCGAIGGSLTYSLTPTSLGLSIHVKHAITKNKLDLTDYDSW